MTIICEITVRTSATPEQLAALGSSLWQWCNRSAGNMGGYQYLDNQVLTDLISGKLPGSSQMPKQSEQRLDGIHFRFCDEVSPSRRAAIASLRREIACPGVKDILVDGISWNLVESKDQT